MSKPAFVNKNLSDGLEIYVCKFEDVYTGAIGHGISAFSAKHNTLYSEEMTDCGLFVYRARFNVPP